mmetsp:Transcript_33573/g.53584  ORF Transcript_33573/g.53584 Transcript_33573/m.53584 type:complete len:92 (+) Transcript_33573:528-803(+)
MSWAIPSEKLPEDADSIPAIAISSSAKERNLVSNLFDEPLKPTPLLQMSSSAAPARLRKTSVASEMSLAERLDKSACPLLHTLDDTKDLSE